MKNKVISDTFKWLFIGLLVCFGISYYVSTSNEMLNLIYGNNKIMIYITRTRLMHST